MPRSSSQPPTPFWVAVIGAPADLEVRFVLADRDLVSRPDFAHFYNVGLFVPCVGRDESPYMYARARDGSRVAVSPLCVRFKGGRDQQLEAALRSVLECAIAGQTVCVHCNETVHRGPVGIAAILRKIVAVDVQDFLQWFSGRRSVWPTC